MVPPLVLIAFNRPDLLRQQLEIVRQYHKGQIFCVVDGPRAHKEGEDQKVAKVVALLEGLRPQFEVSFNCAESNMGCKLRIQSGLDWVFDQVESAIILEDDCHPSPSFFTYATEMLSRFADNSEIFAITGANLSINPVDREFSYFFSRYANIWGWATWRRSWKTYIRDASTWEQVRGKEFNKIPFTYFRAKIYWRRLFDRVYSGKFDTWDYQFVLTTWLSSQLWVVPKVNLIENMGLQSEGTHTFSASHLWREALQLKLPLKHPGEITGDVEYDLFLEDNIFSKSILCRIIWFFRKVKIKLLKESLGFYK